MQAQEPQFSINETSSYVVGYAVPNLREEHTTDESLCKEYTKDESVECDFRGILSELNHQGVRAIVGGVVGYQAADDIETVIELPANVTAPSVLSKNGLMFGLYKDLSLQHGWKRNRDSGTVSKTAIEVSLCKEGAREGSHITEFYPSRPLLNVQSHKSIEAFANRYKYPAPPTLHDVAPADLAFADVHNSPEMAQYVDNILWPLVYARRQRLLKSKGYIAASKLHKSSTITTMASTPAAAAIPTATPIVSATTPSSTATPVVETPAQTPAAVPATPTSTLANAFGMAQQPQAAKPGPTVTSPPVVETNNAMAEDLPEDRMAVLTNLSKKMDEQAKLLHQQQEALVAASKDREMFEAEKKRYETEKTERELADYKTQVDMLIGNTDAWDIATQSLIKNQAHQSLELNRSRSPSERRQLFEQQFNELVACSKQAQQAIVPQSRMGVQRPVSNNQWASQQEHDLAIKLTQQTMVQKNSKQFSTFPPPVPFNTSAQPSQGASASNDDSIEQSSKRGAVATDNGTVAASRTTITSAPLVPEVTQGSEGWAGKCFKLSIEAQSGEDRIVIPSQTDLQKGGIKTVMTGFTRKSKAADGTWVKTNDVNLEDRFTEAKPFGLKEYDPAFYNDLMTTVKTGVLTINGKRGAPVAYDQTVRDRCINDARHFEENIQNRSWMSRVRI